MSQARKKKPIPTEAVVIHVAIRLHKELLRLAKRLDIPLGKLAACLLESRLVEAYPRNEIFGKALEQLASELDRCIVRANSCYREIQRQQDKHKLGELDREFYTKATNYLDKIIRQAESDLCLLLGYAAGIVPVPEPLREDYRLTSEMADRIIQQRTNNAPPEIVDMVNYLMALGIVQRS